AQPTPKDPDEGSLSFRPKQDGLTVLRSPETRTPQVFGQLTECTGSDPGSSRCSPPASAHTRATPPAPSPSRPSPSSAPATPAPPHPPKPRPPPSPDPAPGS